MKFLVFSVTQILREINFGHYDEWWPKNYLFDCFSSFEFWLFGNFTLENVKNIKQIQNSELFIWSKWQFWELHNDQNWFHVKSEWQKNPEIFTLCIRRGLVVVWFIKVTLLINTPDAIYLHLDRIIVRICT